MAIDPPSPAASKPLGDGPSLPESSSFPEGRCYQPDSEMLEAPVWDCDLESKHRYSLSICLNTTSGAEEGSGHCGKFRSPSLDFSNREQLPSTRPLQKTHALVTGTVAHQVVEPLPQTLESRRNTKTPGDSPSVQRERIQKLETRIRELKDFLYAADQLQGLTMDMMDISL